MLIQPAQRDYRTWIIDSRRWEHYRPRPTDIVIATYPKCGTTWMQRIVDLLVFQTPQPRPIMEISPWIDRRFPEPIEALLARIEAQDHRRFVKSHLPFDGLPIYDEMKYIHVGRDGRDACLSFHNHVLGFTAEALDELDRTGLDDDTIRRPYPRIGADPAQYFHRWLNGRRGAGPPRRLAGQCHSSTSSKAGGSSGTAPTSSSSTTTTSRRTSPARCGGSPTFSRSRSRRTSGPSWSKLRDSRPCVGTAPR